jgi:hypothetical protein
MKTIMVTKKLENFLKIGTMELLRYSTVREEQFIGDSLRMVEKKVSGQWNTLIKEFYMLNGRIMFSMDTEFRFFPMDKFIVDSIEINAERDSAKWSILITMNMMDIGRITDFTRVVSTRTDRLEILKKKLVIMKQNK